MIEEKLTVRALSVRAVNVPMSLPLVTGGGAVSAAPLALIDLETMEGVTGCAYVFCYTSVALKPVVTLIGNLGDALQGERVAPLVMEEKLGKTFRLLGLQGLTAMATAGIDMAAWDALSKAAGVPLARLLGGEPQPVAAYNSKGLGIIGPEAVGEEAERLLAEGFRAVKVRLGYADAAADVEVVRAVRSAVGNEIALMSDYNQCLTATEAQQRIARLDEEDLHWVEEPVRFDDYSGCARIRRQVRTPIQIGENCWGAHDMEKALDAGACDYFMPDAVKIGGVSGWLRAAALAESIGMPVSSHLYPEISAHLLSVTPTRHWLEYVDWASPVLQQPVTVKQGCIAPLQAAGTGIVWNEDAVRRYQA
ncbi:MAG TPA: enolase C-terminal domain-like protein [Gammaproteobacteria bacterium]|nr:enolase C-terminal domain-like protein [Gammaproteobacteria bacterium]